MMKMAKLGQHHDEITNPNSNWNYFVNVECADKDERTGRPLGEPSSNQPANSRNDRSRLTQAP